MEFVFLVFFLSFFLSSFLPFSLRYCRFYIDHRSLQLQVQTMFDGMISFRKNFEISSILLYVYHSLNFFTVRPRTPLHLQHQPRRSLSHPDHGGRLHRDHLPPVSGQPGDAGDSPLGSEDAWRVSWYVSPH